MSVESPTDSESGQPRSRRARFREWRHNRPFAGGVLLCLAGLVIGWVPYQFAFELMLVGGSYTFIGLTWAVGVFLMGAFVLYRPDLSTIFGVMGVVLSILSLLGALGGLLLGMILGIVGGNLCVAWSPPEKTADRRESTRGGDGKPVRTDGGEPGDAGDDRPRIMTDGGEPSDARRSSSDPRSDDGRPVDGDGDAGEDDDGVGAAVLAAATGSLARVRSALAEVVSPREAELAGAVAADVRSRARDVRVLAARPPRENLLALRRSATGLVDAARPGGSSRRLAVTLALLVVASGTLTLVSTLPAAAILGDNEQTTYTVDVGEVQLDDGGQICAASVGSDTYRVTISDATLVDTTIYQQRGDDAVRTSFPTLEVDDTIVMYTSGEDDQLDLLATTLGCTEEDQTTRTVFRNQYQTGSTLVGSEGVTMLNMERTDAAVPEAGGFQFVAPDENGTSPTNVTGGVERIADDIGDVVNGTLGDRLENATGDVLDVNGTVRNVTDGPVAVEPVENVTGNATNATEETVSTVGETVANTTEDTVENTTREVAGDDPPENVSGTVDGTTDVADTATGEVANTTDDVTDATDQVANSTGDETTSAVVDDTTDVVDGTTEGVANTTDEVTDAVDGTTEQVVRPVEEPATPEATPSPTEVPITPTEVLTPTATPEDETPAWFDQVDDDERTSILETVEETEGGFDDVENVTEETDGYSEEAIDGDENLTRLENGTVLLLNGTDPGLIDWATDLPLDTDLTSTGDGETEARDSSGDGDAGTETDDGAETEDDSETDGEDGTLFG